MLSLLDNRKFSLEKWQLTDTGEQESRIVVSG
jgi:hypothetical protein